MKLFDRAKNGIKKTWMIIKQNLNSNSSRKLINEFEINGHMVSDPDEIANKFNEYFLNIAFNLSAQIKQAPSHETYLHNPTGNVSF